MARIAEAARIELRVFPRDQHMDIMNEFLKNGEFMSIPVAVFYTKDHQHIGHWIERPALAEKEQAQINQDVKRELGDADEQEVRAETRARIQARYPAWQQESVREMRQLLAEHIGID